MKPEELKKALAQTKRQMQEAVKELDFIVAAKLRDEIKQLEQMLEKMQP
jgi:excinuclease ABC subunit B